MAIDRSTAAKNAACNAVVDLVDGGAGAGYIEIRSGSTHQAGKLLGTLTMSDPAFGAASGGVASANAITPDTSADDSDDAGIFDVYDSNGTYVFGGTVTATGGGGDLTMPNVTITVGETISIDTFTYTVSD